MKFTTIKTALATAGALMALSAAPALAEDTVRTISAGNGEGKPTVITVDSHDTLTVQSNEALEDVLERRYDRQGKHHWGLSALQIVDHPQHQAKFNGNIWGVMPSYSFQPFGENFSVGANALFYTGGSGLAKSWNVPAVNGPLAGRLVGDASSNSQYRRLGLGLGPEFTYFFPVREHFDIGVRLDFGLAVDVRNSTQTDEKSSQRLDGVILQGSEMKNTSSQGHSGSLYKYATASAPFRFGNYCVNPGLGIMANPGAHDARGNLVVLVGGSYCPPSNSDKKVE